MQIGRMPKIQVSKIALEIIRDSHHRTLLTDVDFSSMTRDQVFEAVQTRVQADRLKLTDTQFRQFYVNYIRNYWGGKKP